MNVGRNELAPIFSYTDSGILRELNRPTRVLQAVFRTWDSLQANVAAAVAVQLGSSEVCTAYDGIGFQRTRSGGTHNVTPEEDYRTALLSDSPDAGVRYALRWER